ncbi:Uncharacterised protein [Mycobacteroides abscessus]|nr:Uncharacterised protein [Mycobacteroides abscessus]
MSLAVSARKRISDSAARTPVTIATLPFSPLAASVSIEYWSYTRSLGRPRDAGVIAHSGSDRMCSRFGSHWTYCVLVPRMYLVDANGMQYQRKSIQSSWRYSSTNCTTESGISSSSRNTTLIGRSAPRSSATWRARCTHTSESLPPENATSTVSNTS